jgi:hypothetical protein
MGILEKFFPAKTVVSSAIIRAEITERESEIKRLQAEIGPKLAAIATMTDAEHVTAGGDVAATKRAIDRLDARIAHLQSELPAVLAAEEATAKAAADAALRARAEACRKANEKEAAKLLAAYDEHASAIGGIIAKLKAMDGEREAINAELRANPVCEPIVSSAKIHRTIPGTEATEQRAKVPCWVYRDIPPQPDEVYPGETETVVRATLDDAGKPIPQAGVQYGRFGRVVTPALEKREVVISRTRPHPPRYEHPLDDLLLPPGFAGGKWHWPRS